MFFLRWRWGAERQAAERRQALARAAASLRSFAVARAWRAWRARWEWERRARGVLRAALGRMRGRLLAAAFDRWLDALAEIARMRDLARAARRCIPCPNPPGNKTLPSATLRPSLTPLPVAPCVETQVGRAAGFLRNAALARAFAGWEGGAAARRRKRGLAERAVGLWTRASLARAWGS